MGFRCGMTYQGSEALKRSWATAAPWGQPADCELPVGALAGVGGGEGSGGFQFGLERLVAGELADVEN